MPDHAIETLEDASEDRLEAEPLTGSLRLGAVVYAALAVWAMSWSLVELISSRPYTGGALLLATFALAAAALVCIKQCPKLAFCLFLVGYSVADMAAMIRPSEMAANYQAGKLP
ncbi:hypothetical protein [Adhaeretor mobilis]|uniref:Uncharacterized protein n=1 Tax=Adhaeretor mobilis TaxID=1930276 RepID=A0A517MQI5_9BACT|nr:hypothetical protein [Adhaeretor mobilis]QDS97148.1 hypothetical protein HG15A2_04080 [Adhaeretor mobilis]